MLRGAVRGLFSENVDLAKQLGLRGLVRFEVGVLGRQQKAALAGLGVGRKAEHLIELVFDLKRMADQFRRGALLNREPDDACCGDQEQEKSGKQRQQRPVQPF